MENLTLLEERINGLIAEVVRLKKERKGREEEGTELKKLLDEREVVKKKIEQIIAKIEEIE